MPDVRRSIGVESDWAYCLWSKRPEKRFFDNLEQYATPAHRCNIRGTP